MLAERVDELLDEVVRRTGGQAPVPGDRPRSAWPTAPRSTHPDRGGLPGRHDEPDLGRRGASGSSSSASRSGEDVGEDEASSSRRPEAMVDAGQPHRGRRPRVRQAGRRPSSRPAARRARSAATRSTPRGTSARGPTATGGDSSPSATADGSAADDALRLLQAGEIAVEGRMTAASNATLYAAIALDGVDGALRLQAGRGGAAAVRLPRGTRWPAARSRRTWSREATGWDAGAADGVARRAVRAGQRAAVDRRPTTGTEMVDVVPLRRRAGRAGCPCSTRRTARAATSCWCTRRPAAGPDGGLRRRDRQRRPQGRARAGRRGRAPLGRRPRADLQRRRQAAHRALGLAGRAAADGLRRRAWPGSPTSLAGAVAPLAAALADLLGPEEIARTRERGRGAWSARGRFPRPDVYGPVIPWPPF